MKKCKWYPTLLTGLALLLAGSVGACDPTATIPSDWDSYSNHTYGYSIRYPGEWLVEAGSGSEVSLRAPYPQSGHIIIAVVEDGEFIMDEFVEWWLTIVLTGTDHVHYVAIEKGTGDWDRHVVLNYSWHSGEYAFTSVSNTYFRQTNTHVYTVTMEAKNEDYDSFPFQLIISTFQVEGACISQPPCATQEQQVSGSERERQQVISFAHQLRPIVNEHNSTMDKFLLWMKLNPDFSLEALRSITAECASELRDAVVKLAALTSPEATLQLKGLLHDMWELELRTLVYYNEFAVTSDVHYHEKATDCIFEAHELYTLLLTEIDMLCNKYHIDSAEFGKF